jgi:GntR family transcriptional regulator/MocR family aminotransferase
MRLLYAERRAVLVDALRRDLPRLEILGDAAGLHLAVALPDGRPDRETAERAAAQSVWAMPLSACYVSARPRQGLVLGFGGSSARELRDAVRKLAPLVR